MKYLTNLNWSTVVFNAASRLAWHSYTIGVGVYEGGVVDLRTIVRDWNCLGLPDLVDEGMFKVSMGDIQEDYTTIYVFEEDDSTNDPKTFIVWPRAFMMGRFVNVDLDGSHGEYNYFVAMFRDDEVSRDQAMLFKLTYC